MPYQKTAKDKAWDRERTKLQAEIQKLRHDCACKDSIISAQEQEMLAMFCENEELKEVIAKLTKEDMTPDEAVVNLRSAAKIGEMASFIMGWERGGYL